MRFLIADGSEEIDVLIGPILDFFLHTAADGDGGARDTRGAAYSR